MLRKKLSTTAITINAMMAWLFYAGAYICIKNNPHTDELAAYFALVGEVGLDIIAAILAFKLWKKADEQYNKTILLVFVLAFVFAIAADGIYNIVLNLYHFQYTNPVVVSLFDVPFALFLFFQLIAWAQILFLNREVNSNNKTASYIPYVIVSVLMFVMFMFEIPWKIEHFSAIGLFQAIDTVLEVIGFALATICLARAKTTLIRFVTIGYLIVVSSDFIIRYHVVSGLIPYLSPLEATWVLGLLLIVLGFFLTDHRSKNDVLRLLPVNSLQSLIAIWLLILWIVSAFLFSGLYYLFSQDTGANLNQITRNLLSMLVPFSVLVIIFSHYLSTKISAPLSRLENIISNFIDSDSSNIPKTENSQNNFIFELITLENFVFDTFALYKKKHHIEMEYAKTVTQVAHDLKSPLIALETVARHLVRISDDEKNVISSAINRIREITENILAKHRYLHGHVVADQNSNEMIFPLLESIISEKKIQFRDRHINIRFVPQMGTESTFCSINATDFKRVISNVIDNAVESINEVGQVTVLLQQNFKDLMITINDTGCGIPNELLDKLAKGFSYKKDKGNGLGLQHAIRCITEWRATYTIHSTVNVGTSFNIHLPIETVPKWINRDIYLLENPVIVIVDDDACIYNLWKGKFTKYFRSTANFSLIHLTSVDALQDYLTSEYVKIEDNSNIIFLVDYHFTHSNSNGIDAIKNHSLAEKSILVTSRYPDKIMKDALVANNIKMILKKDINNISIHIIYSNADLVLLDDKRMVTKTWMMEALKYNKKLVTFNSVDTFLYYLHFFKKSTILFLDSDLGQVKGEELAKQLYKKGYANLYLTTGFATDHFPNMPWIKGIFGKEPIFFNDSTGW